MHQLRYQVVHERSLAGGMGGGLAWGRNCSDLKPPATLHANVNHGYQRRNAAGDTPSRRGTGFRLVEHRLAALQGVSGALVAIILAWVVITTVLGNYGGTLGNALSTVATPIFAAGVMIGAREVDAGNPLRFEHLFAGFRSGRFGPLLRLGLINLAFTFLVIVAVGMLAASFVGVSTVTQFMTADTMDLMGMDVWSLLPLADPGGTAAVVLGIAARGHRHVVCARACGAAAGAAVDRIEVVLCRDLAQRGCDGRVRPGAPAVGHRGHHTAGTGLDRPRTDAGNRLVREAGADFLPSLPPSARHSERTAAPQCACSQFATPTSTISGTSSFARRHADRRPVLAVVDRLQRRTSKTSSSCTCISMCASRRVV